MLQATTKIRLERRALTRFIGFSNLFFFLMISGCNRPGDDVPEPTYSWLSRNVFEPKCVSCHTMGNATNGVNLSSYSQVMATGSVVSGDPSKSSLYTTTSQGLMPKSGSRLSDEEIQAVFDWISAGAKENNPASFLPLSIASGSPSSGPKNGNSHPKIFSRTIFFAASLWALNVQSADQANWVANLDRGEGSLEFIAIGKPKAVKVLGKGAAPKGKFVWKNGKGSGKFTFALDTLDTGIELRNQHMKKKYLETGTYPQAVLELTSIAIPPEITRGDFASEETPFRGQLLLHGVTSPIQGVALAKKEGHRFQFDVKFTIKISDYKIAVPSYMGITVADEVHIQVQSKSPLSIHP